MRGRAGGLQPIRGTGLGKPELLAQQEHRYGSSPENQVVNEVSRCRSVFRTKVFPSGENPVSNSSSKSMM